MKTINLSDLDNSDIKYKISNMPDGQQDIVLNVTEDIKNTYYGLGSWNKSRISVLIKSRFNSFKDLELILCTTKALKRLGVSEVHLYIPYLLGARSDRQFQEGGTSYLVDIIAPIINTQKYESVTVLDVHSDVAPACINNLKIENNIKLVEKALSTFYFNVDYKDLSIRDKFKDFILVSPDAGASKKIENLAKFIGYTGDIITCSKSRDTEGNLTKTVVPLNNNYAGKDFIIIDDICDGGRTFINIAKEIRDNPNSPDINKIYLIVTHGIFSAGFEELNKYFDCIYTTNSVRKITDKYFDLNSKVKDTKIKQLEVI